MPRVRIRAFAPEMERRIIESDSAALRLLSAEIVIPIQTLLRHRTQLRKAAGIVDQRYRRTAHPRSPSARNQSRPAAEHHPRRTGTQIRARFDRPSWFNEDLTAMTKGAL